VAHPSSQQHFLLINLNIGWCCDRKGQFFWHLKWILNIQTVMTTHKGKPLSGQANITQSFLSPFTTLLRPYKYLTEY
jgi:hypothetical protein